MDKDGYPEEHELLTIEKWDIQNKHIDDLFGYISLKWSTYGHIVRKNRKKEFEIRLSTGGWSGNESIIEALQRNNLVWGLYWYRSQRGGHYWFLIPNQSLKPTGKTPAA